MVTLAARSRVLERPSTLVPSAWFQCLGFTTKPRITLGYFVTVLEFAKIQGGDIRSAEVAQEGN